MWCYCALGSLNEFVTSSGVSYLISGFYSTISGGGTQLRHCTTSRNVMGSIPDIVIGSFRPQYGIWSTQAFKKN